MTTEVSSKINPERLMEEARKAAQQGGFDQVEQYLRKILEQESFHVEANSHLAWIYSQQGKYGRALTHYTKLLIRRPWVLQAYLRTAQSGCFLLRSIFDRIEERLPPIGVIRRLWQVVLRIYVYHMARKIEIMQGRASTISSWMRHHNIISKFAAINSYEYYKVQEISFAIECLGDQPQEILDMGCGSSGFPSFLSFQGYSVNTIDLDHEGLSVQKKLSDKYPEYCLHASKGDFLNLPFKGKTFDAISLISAIEHIPGDGDVQTVKNLGALLRDNGDLIITVPVGPNYFEQWTSHQIGHVYAESGSTNEAKGFLRVYDPDALSERLIKPSGLRIERLALIGEKSQWGWLGLGRNFVSHKGLMQPSIFLGPLSMLFSKEIAEEELTEAHWSVACIHLKK
jgi:SAM-dependent methyltransferase